MLVRKKSSDRAKFPNFFKWFLLINTLVLRLHDNSVRSIRDFFLYQLFLYFYSSREYVIHNDPVSRNRGTGRSIFNHSFADGECGEKNRTCTVPSTEQYSWHQWMTTYRLIICIGILDTIIKHCAQVGKQSRVTKQDIYIYVVGIIACSQQRL